MVLFSLLIFLSLRFKLLNNSKYSDIEILCEYEKKLHGCRAILAARSEEQYLIDYFIMGIMG